MAVDEAGGLDDVPGVGDIAAFVRLPDGLVGWLSYDAVLVTVGGVTCREERGGEEMGVGVAEPDGRGGFGLGLGFLGVVGRGVLEVDEDAQLATAHGLFGVGEVIAGHCVGRVGRVSQSSG